MATAPSTTALASTTSTTPAPPAAPTDVIAYADPASTFGTVSWMAPADPGPIALASFVVTTVPSTATLKVPASQHTTMISGLSPTTGYTVQVRAVDTSGTSSAPASTTLVNGAGPGQSTTWAQFAGGAMHTGQSVEPGPMSAANAWSWIPGGGLTVQDADPQIGANGDLYIEGYRAPSGSAPGQAEVYVLSPATHDVLWTWSPPGSFSDMGGYLSVAPGGGFYYTGPAAVFAVASGGAVKWQTGIPDADYSGLVSPAVLGADGLIYVQVGWGTLWAINGSSGQLLWQYQLDATGCGATSLPSLSPDDNTVYIEGAGTVYALTAGRTGGQVRWKDTLGTDSCIIHSVAAVGPDGAVYLTLCQTNQTGASSPFTYSCAAYALNSDGTQKWKAAVNTGGSVYGDPAVTATGLVLFGDSGAVHALSAASGAAVWTYQAPGVDFQVDGAPTAARDGTIYLQTQQAVVALSNFGSMVWTHPENSGSARSDLGTTLALDSAGTLFAVVVDGNNDGRLVAFRA